MGDVRFAADQSMRLATRLLAGASIFALTLTGAQPALADTATQPAASTDEEKAPASPLDQPVAPKAKSDANSIIVTGIRASLRSARNIKKNSDQMVDSITSQDIGALPDRSVSEALQRVPGVTLQRTNAARDPARLSAEGGGVFVRGLSWVRSEFNGRDTFSANSGRSLSFEDVPADLLAGVDVYKNPSAELVEGGIGGLVNLRTRKPFDQSGQLIAFSTDINYADMRKQGFWSGNALYSNRWSTGLGEIGILLSGSRNNIGNRTDEVQTGAYNGTTAADGNTYFFPVSLGFRRIDWNQRRTAIDGSVQWKPADTFTLTLEGIYAHAKSHDVENVVGVDSTMPAPGTTGVDYTFDSDNNVLAGHIPAATGGYGFLDLIDARSGHQSDTTKDFSANARWQAASNFTVTADVQHVQSSMHMLSMTAFDQLQQPVDVDFDLRGDNPYIHFTPPGDAQLQQSNYWWAAAMDHFDNNDAKEWAYRADGDYEFKGSPFLKSFRFGARATDRNAISRASTWNWSILSHQFWGGGAPVYLNETGAPGLPQNPGLPNQSKLFDFSDFFRGDVPSVGSWWVPARSLVSAGTANAYDYLQSTLSGGWGWSPIPKATYVSVNDQTEKTLGGYGMLRFANESGLRFDGNIGVRIVRTKNDAGDLVVTQPTLLNIPSVSTCQANATAQGIDTSICDPLAQLYAFTAGGTSVPVLGNVIPTKNNYTDVLPTLNLRFFLQDNMFLRFAAGRAISRPSFSQMRPTVSLGINFDSITGFPSTCNITPPTFVCNTPFTGVGANPTLKPIQSTQFDTSWEYYFGNAGQLSAAIFYKRLKDFIFAGNQTLTVTNNGQSLDFQLTTVQNGDKGSIKGFELAYQQFYDFLPKPFDGFGLGANLTYVKSSGGRNEALDVTDPNQVNNAADQTLPLEGMSKWAYNLFAMYEKYGFSTRLAYNWRSHYLLTTSAANINRPVWSRSYGQLDGSIFYDVTKNFKTGIQATNLLHSKTYLEVGGADRHPLYSSNVTDRRIAFVIRGQF
jgi:TonB-dependent receptor